MTNIDEIKQRLDIVDVMSTYLKLEKAGRNFKALCPFHQEKTPSFIIFPDRQSWKCFGCGAGGDLFSFVMKREGLAFGDALKLLADKAGVTLETRGKTKKEETEPSERLYQINEAAAQYYHQLLLNEATTGHARDYLKKRGVNDKTVADFRLGFASGDSVTKYLREQGYKEEEILAAGLASAKGSGIYSIFRHRLMFPIRDIKGRLVGFGGRALDDSMPKYLNSRQTTIFDKGSILYGIDHAASAIKEQKLAVIVEGYMDVIIAHQYGMTNVVASMGTALTEKQLKIIKGFTSNLAFALDPDVAGNTATLRGIEIARRNLGRKNMDLPDMLGSKSRLDADIRMVRLPQGKDPDEVIKENPEAWRTLVEHRTPLLEYVMDIVEDRLDLTKPEGKSEACERLLPMIRELADGAEREFYLGKLAALVGISDRKLLEKSAQMLPTQRETRSETREKAHLPDLSRVEEDCLSLLLQHPELGNKAAGLLPDHFEIGSNRDVFTLWSNVPRLEELPETVSPALLEHIQTLTRKVFSFPRKDHEEKLLHCIRRLVARRLQVQGRDHLEEYCLSCLLHYPELANKAAVLLPDHFGRTENIEVFFAWRDAAGSKDLFNRVNPALQEHFQELAGRLLPPAKDSDLEIGLGDCIRRLEERRLRLEEEFLTAEAVSLVSDNASDPDKLDRLKQQTVELDARLVRGMIDMSARGMVSREDRGS